MEVLKKIKNYDGRTQYLYIYSNFKSINTHSKIRDNPSIFIEK